MVTRQPESRHDVGEVTVAERVLRNGLHGLAVFADGRLETRLLHDELVAREEAALLEPRLHVALFEVELGRHGVHGRGRDGERHRLAVSVLGRLFFLRVQKVIERVGRELQVLGDDLAGRHFAALIEDRIAGAMEQPAPATLVKVFLHLFGVEPDVLANRIDDGLARLMTYELVVREPLRLTRGRRVQREDFFALQPTLAADEVLLRLFGHCAIGRT